MQHKFFFILGLTLNFFAFASNSPSRLLVLVGGGSKPTAALQSFIKHASARSQTPRTPRILLVAWATSTPEASISYLKKEFGALHPGLQFVGSPVPPKNEGERKQFLKLFGEADGIFFSGGDQAGVLEAVERLELRNDIQKAYQSGAAFGGTSAGTAIMSEKTISGWLENNTFTMVEGLGLLSGTILDQHFFKRQRESRLRYALKAAPKLIGIGIDEDAALIIKNENTCQTVGGNSLVLRPGKKETTRFLVRSGNTFVLEGKI